MMKHVIIHIMDYIIYMMVYDMNNDMPPSCELNMLHNFIIF